MNQRAALILALTLLTGTADAQTVYKSFDASGNVIYSEVPPEDSRGVERIPIEPGPSQAEHSAAQARQQELQEASVEVDLNQARRSTEQQAQRAKIEEARATLEQAEQALIESRVKSRKDYQDTSKRNRLKKSYFDRVRFHEQQLLEARERLQQVGKSSR